MPAKPQIPARKSLILDPIHPRDWRELEIIYCCEQCSHFALDTKTCTLGYEAHLHMREAQARNYEMYGRVAFCRFTEID
jgi:hypothetical protein